MKVEIPVLLAHPSRDTPGDHIRWSPGQKAVFGTKREPVTIISGEFVGHVAAPGKLCIEVTFEDGTANCVLASSLRLKE